MMPKKLYGPRTFQRTTESSTSKCALASTNFSTFVIFERARFNRRNQLGGESIEQYIVALYHLVEDCQYGAMKEELIRDRLVVGIRDEALSQKLQMDPKFTLEGAKKAARQREAVQEHQQLLKAALRGQQEQPAGSI